MEAFAPLDTIIPLFLNAGKNSSEHFGNVAAGFFVFSAWVAIAWAGIRIMAGTDSLEGGVVSATGWMLRLYILGVIGAFLLPTIIPAMIEAAFDIGTGVSGGVMSAADFLMPTRLALVGWTEVEKLMKHAMSRVNGPMSFFANIPVLVYYLLAHLVRNPGMVPNETICGVRRFHRIVFQRCVRCPPILHESFKKLG